MKFINHFSPALNKWPSLHNYCIRVVFIFLKLRPEPTAPNALSSECISAHTQAHKGELTAGLADTGVYLSTANALPANSWKSKAARSQTPLTRVACDKKPHFCISASVSITEQVSCFTAKGALSRFLPAHVSLLLQGVILALLVAAEQPSHSREAAPWLGIHKFYTVHRGPRN